MSASTSTVTTGCIWLAKVANQCKVALPPLAYTALDQYLAQRQLPVSRERWNPKTPPVGSLGKTVMPASPALTFGACCEDSLRKPLRPLRPIIRSPPKSCAVPRLIGCVTVMPAMRWPGELSSPRCATTYAMRRSPRRRCICMAMSSSAPGRCGRLLALVTSSEESTEFSSYGMTEFSGIPA